LEKPARHPTRRPGYGWLVRTDAEYQLPVPDRLRRWVTGADVSAASPDTRPLVRLPDPATRLVLRRATGQPADLLLVGPQTRASYLAPDPDPDAGPVCVSLRLRPGRSTALLGTSPRDLVDRIVPLADYWGEQAPRLAARLTGEPTAVLAALADTLLDRAAGSAPAGGELTVAAARALADGDRLTVAARRVGVSERHLRNLFHTEVGVSPKHFARLDRLRRVLAAAGSGRGWAELAHAAGYYDQAHLSAEFVALLGVPPGAFAAGRLPEPRRCTAAR
jgi:AraC-like DNA-binding protein